MRCPKCGKPFSAKPTLDGRSLDAGKKRPRADAEPFPALPAEFGRYRVLSLLGRGAMGAVYLAEDSHLGRKVALKIPFIDGADAQRVARFAREGRAAAALHHPNVCTVFDAGTLDGRPYLTMAYIDGTPLEAVIAVDGPLPPRRAAEIARGIARGLAFAHQHGVVHRDLKPANVMVRPDGEPVVTDFGLAKQAGDVDPNEAKLTRVGGLLGTPSYMAPEQVRGDQAAIGPASDVYALGAVLFEMLTGRSPYVGPMTAVLGQILASPVPSVREFRADAPERLDAVCRRALAKAVGGRFESMGAFASALAQFLAAPPNVPAESPFAALADARRPIRRPKPPYRLRSVMIALAVLLPLVGFAAGTIIRIETAKGTLVVEIDDPSAAVTIKDGTLVLSGPDGKERHRLSPAVHDSKIAAGEYRVHVEGADGLELDTSEFTLRKGDRVTIRVSAAAPPVPPPLPVKAPLPQPNAVTAATPIRLPGLPPPPQPSAVAVPFTVGSVYVGNRTYQKGAYAPGVVPYELHVESRDGTKFTGTVYDNGTGRNRATVEGEVTDTGVKWTETSAFFADIKYEAAGVIAGSAVEAKLVGRRKGKWFGDAAVTLVRATGPVRTIKGVQYVFPPPEFSSIFNGKDLTGWEVESGEANAWEARAGVLVADAGAEDSRSLLNQGYLLTQRDYSEFVLRFQFCQPESPDAWGGVAFRAVAHETAKMTDPTKPPAFDFPYHLTVIVGRQSPPKFPTGSLWWTTGGTPCRLPTATIDLKDVGGWNDVEITVRAQSLRVAVNGREVQTVPLTRAGPDSTPARGLERAAGRIGFLKRVGKVQYRNIEVRELAPSVVAADAARRPEPRVVATWNHNVWGFPTQQIKLYSNGRINSVDGDATWTRYNATLVLRWPNPEAPDGAWVDTTTLSDDGQRYEGRNQRNRPVSGEKVDDGDAEARP